MPIFQLVVLSAIQGITEFLPISSSGHLVLVPAFTGWADQGLIIDVAVHVGTLFAVMLYFWRDLWFMMRSCVTTIFSRDRVMDDNIRLALKLILATIPVVIAGFALNEFLKDGIRAVQVVGWATLIFGILLYVADRANMTVRKIEHISWRGAVFIGAMLTIGIAQVLALIPGTSRSGITMTAARFLGIDRADASRFSMLLSIPVILGAGTLKGKELIESGDAQLTNDVYIVVALSAAFALLAIALFMAWIRRASFAPFVIYRILLGGGLLYFAYFAQDMK
ncbi:MAG: undecaprenyl-diphosphate phosphatase, partial [Proteobacteria bacterium]|nr:undecaprenyl-diphosphate phosphatase [Pseudomonadota bacterium]